MQSIFIITNIIKLFYRNFGIIFLFEKKLTVASVQQTVPSFDHFCIKRLFDHNLKPSHRPEYR